MSGNKKNIIYDLDLTEVQFERCYGDITVFGTWFGQDRKPALVLVATNKIGSAELIPCVVPESQSWAWSEEIGDGAHCARISSLFALNLGFGFDAIKTMKIASVIRDCLGDLNKIPPKPKTDRLVVAEAIRTDHDGKQQASEIIRYV